MFLLSLPNILSQCYECLNDTYHLIYINMFFGVIDKIKHKIENSKYFFSQFSGIVHNYPIYLK